VTLLYFVNSNLSDNQFLYIDLFMIIPLSMLMGYTESYPKLTPHLPSSSLISLPVLFSVVGSVAIQFGAQVFVFVNVQQQSWYMPLVPTDNDNNNTLCYQNTVIFMVSSYQYLVTCIAFSISKPFRQPLYTNMWFSISLVLLFGFSIFFTMIDVGWINSLFNYATGGDDNYPIPLEFRYTILIVAGVNAVVTYLYEKIFIWYLTLAYNKMQDGKRAKALDAKIQESLAMVRQDSNLSMSRDQMPPF